MTSKQLEEVGNLIDTAMGLLAGNPRADEIRDLLKPALNKVYQLIGDEKKRESGWKKCSMCDCWYDYDEDGIIECSKCGVVIGCEYCADHGEHCGDCERERTVPTIADLNK